jgi:dUTP pyrophosphatase
MTDLTKAMQFIGNAPTRAYADDAGFDLYVEGDWAIEPFSFVDVDLKCRIKTPEGTWALWISRSSTLRKRGLMVATGVIDPGYTGPLFAGVFNLTKETVHVPHGDRLAQLILFDNVSERYTPEAVEELPETGRGANGFGSSGN